MFMSPGRILNCILHFCANPKLPPSPTALHLHDFPKIIEFTISSNLDYY